MAGVRKRARIAETWGGVKYMITRIPSDHGPESERR